MKAEWLEDTKRDKTFKRPCCPECSKEYGAVPVVYDSGRYVCLNCKREVELDKKQKKWVDDMRRTRTKIQKCLSCGSYKFIMKQRRDPVTRKWTNSSGKCSNCGMKMIV